jgi:NADP-dependent 3-hydroxy acid dehydrogenase YdfG
MSDTALEIDPPAPQGVRMTMIEASDSLAGRVAVVTGATSGIGAATARRLAAAGATVVLTGRRADRLDALAAELPNAVAVAADIGVPGALDPVVANARELGGVDLVVANAGTMSGAPFEESDPADWDRMLDVNLRGLLATSRAFAPSLLAAAEAGGAADLVLVSSANAHDVYPGWAVYGATKAAVSHLARNLRAEYGPRGVRVKCVEPGVTATELGDDIAHAPSRDMLMQARAAIGALDSDDVATAIAFAVALPPAVNVAELLVVPTRQG